MSKPMACQPLVNMAMQSKFEGPIPAVVTMTEPSAMMLTTAGRGCTMLRNLHSQLRCHKPFKGIYRCVAHTGMAP